MSIRAADAVPGGHRAASGLVEDAREQVTAAASVPASGLDDAELARLLTGLTGLEAQSAALRLELMAEAERREVAAREGLAEPRSGWRG